MYRVLLCYVNISAPVLNIRQGVLASEFAATSNLKRKHDDPYVLLTWAPCLIIKPNIVTSKEQIDDCV